MSTKIICVDCGLSKPSEEFAQTKKDELKKVPNCNSCGVIRLENVKEGIEKKKGSILWSDVVVGNNDEIVCIDCHVSKPSGEFAQTKKDDSRKVRNCDSCGVIRLEKVKKGIEKKMNENSDAYKPGDSDVMKARLDEQKRIIDVRWSKIVRDIVDALN